MSFKELPPITAGALATATLMYPVDLVRALKMSAAAEGKSGTAMSLIKDFHAVRESPCCLLCACDTCALPRPRARHALRPLTRGSFLASRCRTRAGKQAPSRWVPKTV